MLQGLIFKCGGRQIDGWNVKVFVTKVGGKRVVASFVGASLLLLKLFPLLGGRLELRETLVVGGVGRGLEGGVAAVVAAGGRRGAWGWRGVPVAGNHIRVPRVLFSLVRK